MNKRSHLYVVLSDAKVKAETDNWSKLADALSMTMPQTAKSPHKKPDISKNTAPAGVAIATPAAAAGAAAAPPTSPATSTFSSVKNEMKMKEEKSSQKEQEVLDANHDETEYAT
jgi:hypothetical protein